MHVDDTLQDYIIRLVSATRNHPDLALGASPRASLALFKASQALAALRGRDHVIPDDIKYLVPVTLTHRLIVTSESTARSQRRSELSKTCFTPRRWISAIKKIGRLAHRSSNLAGLAAPGSSFCEGRICLHNYLSVSGDLYRQPFLDSPVCQKYFVYSEIREAYLLGEEVPILLEVQNKGWLPIPWLYVYESLPVELAAGSSIKRSHQPGPARQIGSPVQIECLQTGVITR